MRTRTIPNAQIMVQGGPDRDMSIPTQNRLESGQPEDWDIYSEIERIARELVMNSSRGVHVGEKGTEHDALSILARSNSQTDMDLNNLDARLKQLKPEIKGVRVVGIRTIQIN